MGRKSREKRLARNEGAPQTTRVIASSVFQARQSPMPSPAELQQYDALYPGAAKIFFDSYQAQVAHRMKLEDQVIPANVRNERLGQCFGFIICIAALGAGVAFAAFGKDISGLVIAVGFLGALVSVMIRGRIIAAREAKKK